MKIEIDGKRLIREIEELGKISEAEPPVVTRVVFTPADLKARAVMKALCREAGLVVREDAIGNTFARWVGSESQAAAVGTGSHIDAIPNAGKFDGVVGVLGGLEAIRALKRAGFRPKRSIELLIFTSEEPTRFGVGCIGSRVLAGTLSADAAARLSDQAGASLEEIRTQSGFSGELASVKLPAGYYDAFLELHIEQGPILEHERVPLGIVERIAAPASLMITIEGSGGHAGGVLMPDRRDALCAAAELILTLEGAARSSGAIDTVATVGICDVFPGAINSVPARVRLSVDVRDTDLARRDNVLRELRQASEAVQHKRTVNIVSELLNADAPAESDSRLVAALRRSCEKFGFRYLPMTSRAYHDSLFMSRIAPTAMLFIPCRNGYSHRPDEYASAEDIARGALVLAETLASLAGE